MAYLAMLLGGFAVDLVTPLGHAVWAFYLFAVLISMRSKGKRIILLVAGVASALTIFGFLFSPPGGQTWGLVYNRTLGLVLIWAIVWVAMSWRRADEKLTRLQQAVEASGEIVFMTDPHGVITFINPAFTETYGYSAEEVVGKATPRILKGGQIEPDVYKAYWEMLLGKRYVQGEFVNKAKDGRLLNIEGSASAILDARGNITGFLGIQRDITKRKRAEEERSYLASIVESSDDAIIGKHLDGTIVSWNPAAERLYGYSAEEVIGRSLSILIPPDHSEELPSILARIKGGEHVQHYETVRCRKDGQQIPVSVSIFAIKNAHGDIVGAAAVARDISERRRGEAALRASETRYRRLFEAAKDGILILDATTGEIVDVNPFLMDLLGYSKETVMGKKLWELGAFKDISASRWSFADLQAKSYVRYEDLPLESSDGRQVEVEFVSNVYQANGSKVIQCNIRDITGRKRGEAALHASEARYRRLFETAKDGILILDAETGSVVDANPFLMDLLGYSKQAIMGKKLWELGAFKDISASRWSFADLQAKSYVRYEDLPLESSDGRPIQVEFVSNVYQSDGGKVIQCNIRDITERVKAAKELKKTQEQFLQVQKMEAVGRLAGGVAHDFNNLLTVINGYSDLMLESAPPDSPHRSHLEEIKRAGERAAALTRQLLTFSRKQIFMPTVLNLNAIVEGIQKMLRRLIGEDVELVVHLSEPLGHVKADPGQVEQVIMNLTVNARDAMPKGGKLTIETANAELGEDYARSHPYVAPGNYVMLALSDTGFGIDAETQSHIFEPFYTTKDQGKGTGLGLSTVYGIVKQSGGHISVYSEVGRGTTFRVYFPRIDQPVVPVSEQKGTIVSLSGTETVLVVEDEPGVRSLIQLALQSNGYSVLVAASPEEALALAAAHPGAIHLILTDVIMPGLNGKELADRLISMRPDAKALFISGYTADAIAQHGILEEGVAFLPKPFTPVGLLRKVRETIDCTKG